MAIIENSKPKAEAFINFTAFLVDDKGVEHRIPVNAYFPLFSEKAVHKAIIDNREKAMEDGKIVFKVTSINPVEEEAAGDIAF